MSAQGIFPVSADGMKVSSAWRCHCHPSWGGISVQASGCMWAITVISPEKEWLFQQKVSMRKLTSVILTKIAQRSTFRLFKWF